METNELIDSKRALIDVINYFNKEGKAVFGSRDLGALGCYKSTRVLPFLKESGYLDEKGILLKKIPNPIEIPSQIRKWINERDNIFNNRKKLIIIKNAKKDEAKSKLISVVNGINSIKKLKFSGTELSKRGVKYGTSLRPFLLHQGYINEMNKLIKHIDNPEKIDERICVWYKDRYSISKKKNTHKLDDDQSRLAKEELNIAASKLFSIGNTELADRMEISGFSDEALVEELRRREYNVTAEKIIRL